MGDQGLPVVQKGQPLEEWLALAVPALMEQHQLDEQTATQVATDAWNKVNGDGGDASGADQGGDAAGSAQGTDASAYGQAGPGDQPDQTPAPDGKTPKGKTPPPAAAEGKTPKGKAPPFGAKPTGDTPAEGQPPKGKAPFGKPAADPTAQMTGQAPKGDKPTAKPKGPTIPAADGKPLAPAATPQNGMAGMNGQPGMMNGQGQKPQGMNWDNPDSWGNGLDEAGGMGHMMGGEEDKGSGRQIGRAHV